MRFEAGHPVRVEFTKWGGRPHWAFDGRYPPEAIDLARATADRVLPEVADRTAPYDGKTPLPWFDVLASMSR